MWVFQQPLQHFFPVRKTGQAWQSQDFAQSLSQVAIARHDGGLRFGEPQPVALWLPLRYQAADLAQATGDIVKQLIDRQAARNELLVK
jgi:hypothetical protein